MGQHETPGAALAQVAATQPRSNFGGWRRLCPGDGRTSLVEVFLRVVRRFPRATALESLALPPQEHRARSWTYTQLAARVEAVAAALARRQLTRGTGKASLL